ncbi:hypothetical protein Trydic_g12353 [Trypoxylus dichotomus]
MGLLMASTPTENLKEFLNKLNRDFFRKSFAAENSALNTETTQKIWEATKCTTVTEPLRKRNLSKSITYFLNLPILIHCLFLVKEVDARKPRMKTSRTQEDPSKFRRSYFKEIGRTRGSPNHWERCSI